MDITVCLLRERCTWCDESRREAQQISKFRNICRLMAMSRLAVRRYTNATYFHVEPLMTETRARILLTSFTAHRFAATPLHLTTRSEKIHLSGWTFTPCFCQECCTLVTISFQSTLCDKVAHKDISGIFPAVYYIPSILCPGWCSIEFKKLPDCAKC